MGAPIPKPFIEINGKTILEYTVARFLELPFVRQIVISVGKEWLDHARNLFSETHGNGAKIICVEGGDERQYSVFRALQEISDVDLVAIHDAVRPMITGETIRACCRVASEKGAAIVGIPVRDTLKKVNTEGEIYETPGRIDCWHAQTPQIFSLSLYRRAVANSHEKKLKVTDDAELVEALGEPVFMVKGDSINIKLTYPEDLSMIKTLLIHQV